MRLILFGTAVAHDSLQRLLHQLRRLKSIDLKGCRSVADFSFLLLMPRLVEVDVSSTRFSSKDLQSITKAAALPLVCVFKAKDCPGIQNAAQFLLLPSLKLLSVSPCKADEIKPVLDARPWN